MRLVSSVLLRKEQFIIMSRLAGLQKVEAHGLVAP